jgi:hypothetical protein
MNECRWYLLAGFTYGLFMFAVGYWYGWQCRHNEQVFHDTKH